MCAVASKVRSVCSSSSVRRSMLELQLGEDACRRLEEADSGSDSDGGICGGNPRESTLSSDQVREELDFDDH